MYTKQIGGDSVDNKELYHCEKCNAEFWVDKEKVRQRGSLCPNNCSRNFQIYLGETEDEINRRRKEFLENKFNFEIEMTEEEEEMYIYKNEKRSHDEEDFD